PTTAAPPPPRDPGPGGGTTGRGPTTGSGPSSVPGSVLLALASGPVGGSSTATAAAPDVFERVFARAPVPFLSDAIFRVAVLSLHNNLDLGEEEHSASASQPFFNEDHNP